MSELIPVSIKKIPMLQSVTVENIFSSDNIIQYIDYAVAKPDKMLPRTFAFIPQTIDEDYLGLDEFTYLTIHDSRLFIPWDAVLILTNNRHFIVRRAWSENPKKIFIGTSDRSKGHSVLIKNCAYIGRILNFVRNFR